MAVSARLVLAAACVLGGAGVATAGEVVSTGGLELRAASDAVLGRDAALELTLSVRGDVHLVTTLGEVGAISIRDGVGHARLALPAQRSPAIVVVAAVSPLGAIRDWIAVPLAGQATVKVNTDPRAQVAVQVGSSTFGPVVADARGIASVEIVVPPGVTSGRTIAKDRRGAVTEKEIGLGTRPFPRIVLACSPDGQRVEMLSINANGSPATISPEVTVGGVPQAARAHAHGMFEIVRSADAPADAMRIVATYGDDIVATCTLHEPPEAPTRLLIEADRAVATAGTGAVMLRIHLAYPSDRPRIVVAQVEAHTDLGTLGPPVRDGDGWQVEWTIPDAHDDRREATVLARVSLPGHRDLDAAVRVELAPGPAQRIAVEASRGLTANGHARGVITVRGYDRWGNAADLAALSGRARGQIGPFMRRPDGARIATYVAPAGASHGDTVELVDRASGLSTRTTIELRALPSRYALELRAGYLSNLGRIGAPIVSVAGWIRLPVLGEHLRAGVELAGYTSTVTARAETTSEDVSARIRTAPILARAGYVTAFGATQVLVAGGLGIAAVATRLESASSGASTSTHVVLAASAVVGARWRLGPGSLGVEIGYLHARTTGAVAGRVGGIVGLIGYTLER